MLGRLVTFGPKSVEKIFQQQNSFELTTPTVEFSFHLITKSLSSPSSLSLISFCLVLCLDSRKRFEIVDIQNATLSGGVAVGAIADLMLQVSRETCNFLLFFICGTK